MKRILLILICVPFISFAQNKPLLVEGVSPNLYLTHTVAAKENYYSIGRMYNISPKEIAPFNNVVLEKGLSLNQSIKIPLTSANFFQGDNAAADEVLVPVYHTVKEKEGLFRISSNYNKLPVETIKQWNNIKGDAVSNGTKIIIGYLKVKKDLSALSGMAKALPMEKNIPALSQGKAVNAIPEKQTAKPPVIKEILPVVKNPAKEKETEIKSVKEKEPPVVNIEEKPLEKKEGKPMQVTAAPTTKNFKGGLFKNDFDKQTHNTPVTDETGTAAIFKSTSGWQDGKYYCLHNTAAPGTIIKITSTATGKSVYAKVLDIIPDINQNNGLLIRLSNAAAAELGIAENKFDCSLSYSK